MTEKPESEVHLSEANLRRRGISERAANPPIVDSQFDELLAALDAATLQDNKHGKT